MYTIGGLTVPGNLLCIVHFENALEESFCLLSIPTFDKSFLSRYTMRVKLFRIEKIKFWLHCYGMTNTDKMYQYPFEKIISV